jgi:hypothetical protein
METLRMPLEVAFAKLTYGGASGVISAVPLVAISPIASPAGSKPAATVAVAKAPVQMAAPQAPKAIIKAESLEDIKVHWNVLTHEVSLRKMALASYLQEGTPCEFKGGKLVIGFSKENTFACDCLSSKENSRFIEELFSERLNIPVTVNFKIVDKVGSTQEEPVVRSALEMFGGKVVKEWPNAQK